MTSPGAGVVLQFGAAIRAIVVLLLGAAVAVFLIISARDRGGSQVPRLFLLAVIVALAAATVDVLGVAHRLRPDGLERVTPWRSRAVVRWSEVTSIAWVESARWFEVRSRRGESVRVYAQLTGMPSFARAVLDGVASEVIDAQPGLRHRLEQLARGVLPPDEPEREEWRGG